MKIERRIFYDTMKEFSRVADAKAALPVLRHVLLRFREGKLTLRATDYTQFLSAELEAEGGDLTVCLPAKLIATLTKPESKKDACTLEIEALEDNQASVVMNGVKTKVLGMDPQDFPVGIDGSKDSNWSLVAMWAASDLRTALGHVLPAMSNDETRENLQSVLLEGKNIVAVDGHRLHIAESPGTLDTSLLLPSSAAATLHRLLTSGEQVILAQAENILRIRVGQFQFDVKLLDETFPDYHQVVPKKGSARTRLVVDTRTFKKALARVGKLSKEKMLRMRVNGSIILSMQDFDAGETETEVPVIHSDHLGEDILIDFNRTYLEDALKSAPAEVEMRFEDSLSPLRIDLDDRRVSIIMPMRV